MSLTEGTEGQMLAAVTTNTDMVQAATDFLVATEALCPPEWLPRLQVSDRVQAVMNAGFPPEVILEAKQVLKEFGGPELLVALVVNLAMMRVVADLNAYTQSDIEALRHCGLRLREVEIWALTHHSHLN